ncbi:MAG: sugar kinase, partial [Thermoplasmata archaeon]|nr:sugar kinase [Thermoplasmata archaeon]
MKKVVTFGEIMMRLTPPNFSRIVQTRSFDVFYAGSEANVAIALANLGIPVEFVTALPDNDLGDACINYLRQFGVKTDHIVRTKHRLGIYFVEMGAVQRGNRVIYDRANSAFANLEKGMIEWDEIFSDAQWFHFSGISPAVSKGGADVCREAVEKARDKGLRISVDLNYRSKLWKWGKEPRDVMTELVEHCDILIGNEEDAEKIFGIKAPGVDVEKGKLEAERYRYVVDKLFEMFPNLEIVAITLRESISASHNRWSGVISDKKNFFKAETYDITHIVDRVGAGDAFSAGLIYSILKG